MVLLVICTYLFIPCFLWAVKMRCSEERHALVPVVALAQPVFMLAWIVVLLEGLVPMLAPMWRGCNYRLPLFKAVLLMASDALTKDPGIVIALLSAAFWVRTRGKHVRKLWADSPGQLAAWGFRAWWIQTFIMFAITYASFYAAIRCIMCIGGGPCMGGG